MLNSRLDYLAIRNKAETEESAIVFTELRSIRLIFSDTIIGIGSRTQLSNLFIPDIISPEGQAVLNLLENRYISDGEIRPRRSYAYIQGKLSLFRDNPQIIVTDPEQITDELPAAT